MTSTKKLNHEFVALYPRLVKSICSTHEDWLYVRGHFIMNFLFSLRLPSVEEKIWIKSSRCSSWIRKGRRTRDQMINIPWIIEKARKKNFYFCCMNYVKAFDCVDHNRLWKILQEMGIPDHLTWLLRNMHAGQETTVRTEHRTIDWFQTRKGIHQGCICHPTCLTCMQSTSCEMLGWMNHKLESRLLGEISIPQICRCHHP